jgi:hypothetical protein
MKMRAYIHTYMHAYIHILLQEQSLQLPHLHIRVRVSFRRRKPLRRSCVQTHIRDVLFALSFEL